MGKLINQRIKSIIEYSGKSINAYANDIGVSQPTLKSCVDGSNNPSFETIQKIIIGNPIISPEWLLTGEGDMFKSNSNIIGSNQGDSNKIEYNNGGNVGVGNTVNVSLPESGTQKIINPDGSVELTSTDSSTLELELMKKDNEALRFQISHLKDNIAMKDELIASLRETIELLKHRQ